MQKGEEDEHFGRGEMLTREEEERERKRRGRNEKDESTHDEVSTFVDELNFGGWFDGSDPSDTG